MFHYLIKKCSTDRDSSGASAPSGSWGAGFTLTLKKYTFSEIEKTSY